MVKYTQSRRKRHRRKSLRKTRRRVPRRLRGGYSPIGPNGGNYGYAPVGDIKQSSGALPDPMPAVQN